MSNGTKKMDEGRERKETFTQLKISFPTVYSMSIFEKNFFGSLPGPTKLMTSSIPAISGKLLVIFLNPLGVSYDNLKSNPGDSNVHTGGGSAPRV